MSAIAHGWKPPKSSGISVPVSVAREFNAADTGMGVIGPKIRMPHKPKMFKL